MRARTCVSVVVCVARKLRPCPSYSGRRDRNNSVHWRSLNRAGGVVISVAWMVDSHISKFIDWTPSGRTSMCDRQFQVACAVA